MRTKKKMYLKVANPKNPKAKDNLKAFENDLFNIIKNIKLNIYQSNFQKNLKHDLNNLLIKIK